MSLKNKRYYFALPLEKTSFLDLFRFFWRQGVGNEFNSNGDPTVWNYKKLQNALSEHGYEVDTRTIQHWLKGNFKPRISNLHALASVAARGDTAKKRIWANALISSLEVSINDQSGDGTSAITPSNKRLRALFFGLSAVILSSIIIVILSLNINKRHNDQSAKIVNIRLCLEEDFNKIDKVCKVNRERFPSDTSLIYLSFELNNIELFTKFTRQWLYDGRLFLEKESYYDDAWEGFTWIKSDHGFSDGFYHLRIILDDEMVTTEYIIGSAEDKNFNILASPYLSKASSQ